MRIYALSDSKKVVLFGMLGLGLITPVSTTVSTYYLASLRAELDRPP